MMPSNFASAHEQYLDPDRYERGIEFASRSRRDEEEEIEVEEEFNESEQPEDINDEPI